VGPGEGVGGVKGPPIQLDEKELLKVKLDLEGERCPSKAIGVGAADSRAL